MSAAYDTFDYPSYWQGREYEHKSEIFALRSLLSKIHKIKTILEIGAGYGRLYTAYSFRAKKVILSDPSSKLLKIARQHIKSKKNIKFVHASLETLPKKIRSGSVDLIVMVRVAHHIEDMNKALRIMNKMLPNNGYLIFEFANKNNFKARVRQFLKGNFTFSMDVSKVDIRSAKNLKKNTISFYNYHPAKMEEILAQNGFSIVEKLSVSNIRSSLLKKLFSIDFLVALDKLTQKLFSYINFGPSIFILARKRG